MAQSNSKAFEPARVAVLTQLTAAIYFRANRVENGVEVVIRQSIGVMFEALLREGGGRYIGSPEQQAAWGVNWQPLNQSYAKSKPSGTGFYKNSGELIADMRSSARKKRNTMADILGGVTLRSNRLDILNKKNYTFADAQKQAIIDVRSGKVTNTRVKQQWSFSVMKTLMDAKYPEFLFVDMGSENGIPLIIKLGLMPSGHPHWYRPFIKEYARWYARTVIAQNIKQYLLNPEKYLKSIGYDINDKNLAVKR